MNKNLNKAQGKQAQQAQKTPSLKDLRAQLLQQMEQDAGFHAMGREALITAAAASDIEQPMALALFEDADKQVIAGHYWQMRIDNLSALLAQPHDIISTTDKVAYAIKLFLQGDNKAPHQGKTALQHCSASLLLPQHLGIAVGLIWQLSDVIWQFAGDISTDHNYYSKRVLLSQVLLMSLPFYWQDSSADHQDSQAFIDARLKNVVRIGKNIGKASQKITTSGEAMAQLLKMLSPYSASHRKIKPLLKTAMSHSQSHAMPNLRMRSNDNYANASSASATQHPIFVTRKLLKNFVKRRVQKFTQNMMPQS